MKIGQYCQRQRCKHVESEQFWHAFASRGLSAIAGLSCLLCTSESLFGLYPSIRQSTREQVILVADDVGATKHRSGRSRHVRLRLLLQQTGTERNLANVAITSSVDRALLVTSTRRCRCQWGGKGVTAGILGYKPIHTASK